MLYHSGSALATLDEVKAVTLPESTKSYTPIAHDRLIEDTITNLEEIGMNVTSAEHALWRDGLRYFGVFTIENGLNPSDYKMVVGLRNSHDKEFPAGLVIGNTVMVCDNLSFSGEIKVVRRHTTHILRDLPAMMHKAIGEIGGLRTHMDDRITAYKDTELSPEAAHDFLIRSLDSRIVPVTKLPKVLAEYREPRHEDFEPRTAWSMFNAFTEIMKETSAPTLDRRTMALHGLADEFASVSAFETSDIDSTDDSLASPFVGRAGVEFASN